MLKGIYSSAQGMISQSFRQDVIANNLANVNTTGFKKDLAIFEELRINDKKEKPICRACKNHEKEKDKMKKYEPIYKRNYPLISETFTNFRQGSMKKSDNPLDVAISGDGFFVVKTPEGERYTRNGSFSISDDGKLITKEGYEVVGDGGAIEVNGKNVVIGKDGTVTVDGDNKGKLKIVTFEDKRNLMKIGGALFRKSSLSVEKKAENISVLQGYTEESNVNSVKSMVNMIDAYRAYESNQKAITSQDETLGKAVNDVGLA